MEELSPELALVDPELAASARALLHDPGRFRPGGARSNGAAPTPHPAPPVVAVLPLEPAVAVAGPAPVTASVAAVPAATVAAVRSPRSWRHLLALALVVPGAAAAAYGAIALTDGGSDRPAASFPEPVARQPEVASGDATGPRLEQPARPATGVGAPAVARTVAWAPVAGVQEYETQLFRGGVRVYRARVYEPRVTITSPWRHDGRVYRLDSFAYRIAVWPVRAGAPARTPIVDATLTPAG